MSAAEVAVPVSASSLRPPSTDGHDPADFDADAEVPEQVARAAGEHRRLHHAAIARRSTELADSFQILVQPFVYVPLHLQPERSTNPLGGVFDEQYLMVGMISSELPSGWRIYVKEHPSQFAPQFVSERGRWTNLYETLLEIPGFFAQRRFEQTRLT